MKRSATQPQGSAVKMLLAVGLASFTMVFAACKKDDAETAKVETAAEGESKAEDPIPPPADVAAPPSDAEKTTTGLAHKVLSKGSGSTHPNPWDSVTVHYSGWTTDGKMFDSSVKRGRPATFGLKQVIPGWTEGLQLMVEGEKRRFWIPVELAYNNRPGKPAGMLVFDVELQSIKAGKAPIPAPEDVAAAPADAKTTASGLAYKVLQPGKGNKPNEWDKVEVHYTGWMTNGEMFDSSVQRGRPATFGLKGVIKGWTEGLQLMQEGGKTRFWIPGNLAYGEVARRPGAPAGTLVFDVELVKVTSMPKPPDPPAVPKDVAGVPKGAKKSDSGLAWRVLKRGKGKKKPTNTDRVEVHYTGWTTDGKMFDSSITRGRTTTFGVTQVIKGWTEGLKLMVPGEKRRFWIPAGLAYGETPTRPGAPAGMLVFDVELVSIKDAPKAAPKPFTKKGTAPGGKATAGKPASK